MKRSMGYAFAAAIGCLLLSACASTGSNYVISPRYEVDQAKIAEVHRQARETGAQVSWFNLPTKRVEDKDG